MRISQGTADSTDIEKRELQTLQILSRSQENSRHYRYRANLKRTADFTDIEKKRTTDLTDIEQV